MQATRKELDSWAKVENSISVAEAAVDTLLKAAKRSHSDRGAGSVRTKKLVFDRGWEGWWIEDAVKIMNAPPDSIRLLITDTI